MTRATTLNTAKRHFLKAAELSAKEGTGLSYLIRQHGLMRYFWRYRDPVLYVAWNRDDYVLALCMLATLADAGDLAE